MKKEIVTKLKKVGKTVDKDREFPTDGCKEAGKLVENLKEYPHAFVIGCILDRQVKAEVAWLGPVRIQKRVGNFRFQTLKNLSESEWKAIFNKPPKIHRFTDQMASLTYKAVQRIADTYKNDASNIWTGNISSGEIICRFLEFEGIGKKIAAMATKILRITFGTKMSSYSAIDVAIDVHVKRVFYRLGLIPKEDGDMAIYTARDLNPEFPGILDTPVWHIGREWCKAQNPDCKTCPMNKLCIKQGVS